MAFVDQTYFTYPSSIGPLTLASAQGKLCRVAFGAIELDGVMAPSDVTNKAANEIHEYLAGKRQVFSVETLLEGTSFQQEVWARVAAIPYGQTRSYAEIAASSGHPKAYRSVGAAVKANPVPLIIPCHRVVASSGALGGYAFGVALKEFLLNLEKSKA